MSDRGFLIYVDGQGEETMHMMVLNTGFGSIISAIQAVTNALIRESSIGARSSISGTPVVATYPTVRQTANLLFRDSTTGSTARVYVPAPVAGIFLPDGVTVDPTTITSLITAVTGQVLAGSGNLVDTFVGGQLEATRVGLLNSAPLF